MNISIHPNKRKRETVLRKRANRARNKQFRADLYREHGGSRGWNAAVGVWHSSITALQVGSL